MHRESRIFRNLAGTFAVWCFVYLMLIVPTAVPVEVHGAPTNYSTSYNMFVGVLDFQEADHSANISIAFTAQFPMVSGQPDRFGLELANIASGGSSHQETNGTCLDQACSAGFWRFDFFVRFRASGLTDFYPYDSWMFNITLSTPLLFKANATNTEIWATSYVPGWELKWAPATRLVEEDWGPIVVTLVLQRAGWTVTPIRFIPLVLFFVLGLTALIPADDLSSKTTIVTAVILFVAASIFSLGTGLAPRVYGPSFAETVLFYLILLAAVYLGESILENRLARPLKAKVETRRRIVVRYHLVMQIVVVILAVYWIYSYTASFDALASTYWWSGLDVVETRVLPIIGVAVGTILNVLIHTTQKQPN